MDPSEALNDLQAAVFSKRPVLGEIYHTQGDVTLEAFTRAQLAGLRPEYIPEARRKELIHVIASKLSRLVGAAVGEAVAKQLETTYASITADHHGPLTDPGFFNNNLLMQLSGALPYILILSCSNISFDNDSFPRGHLFHTVVNGEVQENQLVLFPRKVRPLTVLFHPSYKSEGIEEAKKRITAWVREESLSIENAAKLRDILDDIYALPQVLSKPSFTDQVTITNQLLWKKLFPSSSSELLYLAQEEVVNELLTAHLKQSSILHNILFSEKYQSLFMKHFDGIRGGFNTTDHSGTFLFWALPKDQKYRVQLWKNGAALTSDDGSYALPLSPPAIAEALERKELIPSTLLSFIVLAFYYGLVLIGGGGQTSYMTAMKKAYLSFCRETGDVGEARIAETVSTTRQALPYPSLAFLRSPSHSLIPASLLDVYLYGDQSSLTVFENTASKATVRQVLARQLPAMFHMMAVMSEHGGAPLREEQVDMLTGFDKVVQAFGEVQ